MREQNPKLDWPAPDILSWKIQGKTLEQWKVYLAHDRANPSRAVMYRILDAYLTHAEQPQSFVEVGFGSCIDFGDHFCHLHDEGRIAYTGYDITEHFVRYAQVEYPGCDFRLGGFRDLDETYDISFTRHTLQHLDPSLLEPSLRALLRAARTLAIITWRMTPGREHILWKQKAPLRPEGGWVNTYDKETVLRIIQDEGFRCEIRSCESGGERDTIYVLEREAHVC